MKVDAHVLLNRNADAFCAGYRDGDVLEHAFTFQVSAPGPGDACYLALEYLFMLGNVDSALTNEDDWEQVYVYREAGNRSLSRGDVVVLAGYGAFKVEKLGWSELAGAQRAYAYELVPGL